MEIIEQAGKKFEIVDWMDAKAFRGSGHGAFADVMRRHEINRLLVIKKRRGAKLYPGFERTPRANGKYKYGRRFGGEAFA